MTSGSREDYLINILRLMEGKDIVKTTELASFMNVAPASVTAMIKTLSNDGLVEYERYKGLTLSEEGKVMARKIRKKHHLIEYFLIDYLGVDHDTAHEEAHKIEHTISDASSIKLCNIVGNPVDGDCDCCSEPCKNYTESHGKLTILSTMPAGSECTISFIRSPYHDVVTSLIELGFVPGMKIKVESISEDGYMVLDAKGVTAAIDSRLSSSVFVNYD